MKTQSEISKLPEDTEVCILLDVEESLLSFETTAGKLVAKGFGALKFECEDLDVDIPTVFVKSLEDFQAIKVVFGKVSREREVWNKLGRPALPEQKRASQQIQLRVTGARKEFYTLVAKGHCMNLSEWILRACDKVSGYKKTET